MLDAAEVEAEVPVGAEDTDEELGVEVEVEDKGEEEEEWVEGEVWEALFAGVPEVESF